jgi:hypothetical protein
VTLEELTEQIDIELQSMAKIVEELVSLHQELSHRTPTVREKTAASAFLAQFYNGVENILKRISRFCSVPLPANESWHVDLFKRFCIPAYPPLPGLFDSYLAVKLSAYRKFRHVVHHGYGFQIEWERMREGIEHLEEIFTLFQEKLGEYLSHADQNP